MTIALQLSSILGIESKMNFESRFCIVDIWTIINIGSFVSSLFQIFKLMDLSFLFKYTVYLKCACYKNSPKAFLLKFYFTN